MNRRPRLPVKNHSLKPAKRLRQAAWLMAVVACICVWQGGAELPTGAGWAQVVLGLSIGVPSLFFAGRSQVIALFAPRKDVAVTEKWFLDLWQVTYPVTVETRITILRQENDPMQARVVIELQDPTSGAMKSVPLDRGLQRYPRAIGVAREAALYLDVPVCELQRSAETMVSVAQPAA